MAHMQKYKRQRGAVLLVGLIIIMAAMATALVAFLGRGVNDSRKAMQTSKALAQAKEALIAYAVRIDFSVTTPDRPGSLPCPDNHPLNDPQAGKESTPCTGNALGRLPWKTLGISDLRDADGERIWYAVSDRFRRNSPIFAFGGINPDTNGRITIRASNGAVMQSVADSATGSVAVLIAPGSPLRRQDGVLQIRSAANYNVAQHYLDCLGVGCSIEDNVNFINGSTTNGFFAGPVRSDNGYISNDQLLSLSAPELIGPVSKLVAKAVLDDMKQSLASAQMLPSPAALTDITCFGNNTLPGSSCQPSSTNFGRVPVTNWGNPGTMLDRVANASNWFQRNGWREHVFYAIAPACQVTPLCSTGIFSVNNLPAANNNVRLIVMVGGIANVGQIRAVKTNIGNYLEDENAMPIDNIFAFKAANPNITFNDAVAWLQ